MDKKLAFQVLGIAETKEEDRIRQRYLSLLKDTNPEDDPEGFKRLREAYEAALRSAGERVEEEEQEPQGEVGLWMKRVRETYRDVFLRRDAEIWKELFADTVCVGFDTFLDARLQILGFLSGHSFLPRTVWQQLDHTFHVLEDFDALKENFHVNFLRHIEYHVNTDDFLDYGLFEALADYGPEDDEEVDRYITEFFEIRNKLEEGETDGVGQALADMTGHGLYHPYEEVERLRLYIRLEESGQGKELAESLLSRYPGDSYVQIWTGKIFSDAGDEERGFALWEAVLEKEPEYYMARYFALGYLMRREQWYQAGKYINELLRVNSRDEELREELNKINQGLVPLVQEAYDKGEGFEDLKEEEVPLFLGRRLYNMERFEEVLALLEKDPRLSTKEEDNLNLKTWTLYRLERYEEAIPVFWEYHKCLEEIADEEERTSKMAQVHRMLGSCYFCLENREEGERETRTAIEMERDERSRLDCKYYLADKYLSFREYERAVEECDEILAADENYYPAYLVRQEACYHLKRGQQVVDDYYRAIEIYPGYDKPYLFAAMIFYNYSQYKDAMGVIERARENKVEFSQKLCFQEAKILRMLSESAEERQKVMELLDALLYATEGEDGQSRQDDDGRPDDSLDRAELIFEKALVFEGDDKLLDAVALVREALKLDPKEPYYHLVLGNLLRDMQNYTAALKEYELVEENYDHAEFYFGMGVCHEEAKNWAKAIYY
ncbi:MAG: tetratricopeptide repeat protein, partial [Lachnospiraceae bacterium]|nr:tetratricopeptide repeat protein [Lachnospiraceae bacterium]